MKRIYTITLEDGEYPSDDVERNIKFLATLLYDEIKNIEYGSDEILYKKDLISNELFETGNGGKINYFFKSQKNEYGFEMYEPFIINNISFGFTVNDGKIDAGMIQILLEHIMKMMKVNYKFKIDDTFTFNKDRERHRFLREIKKKEIIKEKKNNGRKKIKINPLFTTLNIVGR